MKNSMCTLLGTPPNLDILYTALKPRHRRTFTIVIESVGKLLFWKKKNTSSYLKRHLAPYTEGLKKHKKKMKLIKFTYFQCINFLSFGNNEHQHVWQQNMFLISCQNDKNVRTTVYRIAIPLDSKVANWNLSRNQTWFKVIVSKYFY